MLRYFHIFPWDYGVSDGYIIRRNHDFIGLHSLDYQSNERFRVGFEPILGLDMTRCRVIEPIMWLYESIVQYVQRGEWMFVVQYGENIVLFLCKVTERFRANLFKDLWISEKTSKQFGLLSDNSNVKFLWIFCVTPWLHKIFSLIVNPPTEFSKVSFRYLRTGS